MCNHRLNVEYYDWLRVEKQPLRFSSPCIVELSLHPREANISATHWAIYFCTLRLER
ncbi:unnamed protein product [Fusarium graminearum]|uniref:Chromosome 2, complete genome n=1 Tax=Gibberella zeae (strain ATCC MYA-4620 / CBS 123657 / FGSC 9075 / NRRL 31084 / PH-1) TaxID=229533 RepID=A0A098DHL6_GIBZE|nr:unnamed protein product [Fusarium graminearum]CZS81721.1 unnamed protein product [Fusarium graminearum]